MLMRRMMARLGFTSIVSLLLSSCSFDDPLASHLASLGRSGHAIPVTESITLEELYGPEWTEFSLVCPYTPYQTVKETLMADDPPVPEHGFSDHENFLFLRGKGDSEQWVKFSRKALDLCSPSSPSSLIMESTTVALSFSLDNPGSAWILTGLNK